VTYVESTDRPVIIAEPMSVGDDESDEGESSAECQQADSRSVTDDVQQETDRNVEEPRHQQRPEPRHSVVQYQQAVKTQRSVLGPRQ